MRADQIIVAALAAILGTLSCLAAANWWGLPYRLRSIAAVRQKWGLPAARWLLLLVGLLLLALAVIIAADLRPAYHSQ